MQRIVARTYATLLLAHTLFLAASGVYMLRHAGHAAPAGLPLLLASAVLTSMLIFVWRGRLWAAAVALAASFFPGVWPVLWYLTERGEGADVFFVLAKVLWFLLQPSSLMLGCVIAGAALLRTKWCGLARRLVWGGLAALLIGGLSPLGDLLIRPAGGPLPARRDRRRRHRRHHRAGRGGGLPRCRIPAARPAQRGGGALHRGGGPGATPAAGTRHLHRRIGHADHDGAAGGGCGRAAVRGAGCRQGAPRAGVESRATPTRMRSSPRASSIPSRASAGCSSPRPGTCRAPWAAFRQAGFKVEPWPVDYRAARGLDALRAPELHPRGTETDRFHCARVRGARHVLRDRPDRALLWPGP